MRSITVLCVLLLAHLALAAGAQQDTNNPRPRRERMRIGVQLYSVRDDCAKDLPAVLKEVARMGYEGVEFAGYYGRSAEELRKMLDENNLKCCGTHIGLDTLLGDNLEKTIAFNKTLGNKFLVVPGLPAERTASREAWLETAKLFNEINKKLEPHEMYVGYHNHSMEFKPLGGEMPWDTFFGNTDKRVVMQLDSGNALGGDADPVPFLEKYPGRALTVHIKEHSATNDKALVGEGDVRWKDLLPLLRRTGNTQWLIVEQESYADKPLVCIEKCLANLKQMLPARRQRNRPNAGNG